MCHDGLHNGSDMVPITDMEILVGAGKSKIGMSDA